MAPALEGKSIGLDQKAVIKGELFCGKLRLNLHGTCFGGEINWFRPKSSDKRRALDLENEESG
jgi:hypothetical protein